jgi:hypothetical protein
MITVTPTITGIMFASTSSSSSSSSSYYYYYYYGLDSIGLK